MRSWFHESLRDYIINVVMQYDKINDANLFQTNLEILLEKKDAY